MAILLVLVAVACGSDDDEDAASGQPAGLTVTPAAAVPAAGAAAAPVTSPATPATSVFRLIPALTGQPLARTDIQALAAQFDQPLLVGGQVAPRLYKAISEDVSIFLQFDRPNPAEAQVLRYIGLSVKGVFCAESQPDRAFTHFHSNRAVASYADGHGGPPGQEGYWLLWVAVDTLEQQGRSVVPGVDYAFSPTPPPSCGTNPPLPAFQAPGAHAITPAEIQQLAPLFNQNPLTGGQTPPRLYRWVNEQTAIFIQLDKANPAEATEVRYIGISTRGAFCTSKRLSPDFTHYHRTEAPSYAEGHGGPPGFTDGSWLLWVATGTFTAQSRPVAPGVDRAFSPTPPPDC